MNRTGIARPSARDGNRGRNDVLNNSLFRVVLNVGLPLLTVQMISMLAVSYTNDIYSREFGKLVFLVTGDRKSVV